MSKLFTLESSVLLTAAFGAIAFFGSPIQAETPECTAAALVSCPGACVERCIDDDAFYNENAQLCGEIGRMKLKNDPGLDVSQCKSASAVPSDSELSRCLEANRSLERPTTGDEDIDRFFGAAPHCAPTLVALEGMYKCLADETTGINQLYQPLLAQGYGDADPVTQREKLCAINNDRIDQDRILTSVLAGQSTILISAFEEVRDCRQEMDQWLIAESEECTRNRTPLCEGTIEGFISLLKLQIEPARKQEVETEKIIDDIDAQLASIRRAIASRAFVCPQTSD